MKISYINEYFGELVLYPLDSNSESDFIDFKNVVYDPEIMKTVSSFNKSIPYNEKEVRDFFCAVTCTNKKNKICFNKIIDNKNNLVGIVGLFNAKENKELEPQILEIGYLIKKEYRNKKIAGEVSEIILDLVFQQYKSIEKVIGGNLVENKISQRILLKLGFKFKNKKVNRYGAIVNSFVLTREDFYNRDKNKINFDKELDYIENFPVSDEKVEDFVI